MKPKDIQKILANFISSLDYRSILIDGCWGCGKTYETRQFLKHNPNINVAYVSLFGIESLDELNTVIYYQTHKLKTKMITVARTVSKIVQVIPKVGTSIGEFMDSTLSSFENNHDNNYLLIIIDDLERMSSKINYTDLLGYLSTLFHNNCRVLCLVYSEEIKGNKRKADFDSFKEKVFNDYYLIDEKNEDAIKSIIGDPFANNRKLIDLLSGNLRDVEKTKHLYNRITKTFGNYGKTIDEIGIEDDVLMEACYIAVKICFDKQVEKIDNKESKSENDYLELVYIEEFGNLIGQKICKYKKQYKEYFSIKGFDDLIYAICRFYQFYDEEKLIKSFVIEDEGKNDSILNNEFFFLSDANKQKYCDEFYRRCIKKEFEFSDAFVRILASVISFNDYADDDEFLDSIISVFRDGNNLHRIDEIRLYLSLANDFVQKTYQNLENKATIAIIKMNVDKFEQMANECDYEKMQDFLYSMHEKETIVKLLPILDNNGYYMPVLDGDINQSVWSYCHEVADFISKNGDKNKFIECCRNICLDNKENRSLVDRYYALIKYKIENTFERNKLIE